MKRGESRLGGGLDGCSILEEKFHDGNAVLLAGDVKWCEAILFRMKYIK